MNPVAKYFLDHWRGDQSLTWSFFINWGLVYVVATLLVVFLGEWVDLNVYVGIGLLLLIAVWSVIGSVLAAIKALRGCLKMA